MSLNFTWITQEGLRLKELYFDQKDIYRIINIAIISANTNRKQSLLLLTSISSLQISSIFIISSKV